MKDQSRRMESPFPTATNVHAGFNLQALMLALIFLEFLLLISSRSSAQNLSDKPFSLQKDIKVGERLTDENARKILKQTNPQELIVRIKSTSGEQRLNAIADLSYISDEDGRLLIEKLLLSDPSDEIRVACSKALGIIHSQLSEPVLVKALSDNNESVRVSAAFTLALIGEKEESFKFFSTLGSLQGNFPYTCHQAYLYIGTSDVIQPLLNDINNIDPFISIDAAITLSELGFYSDAFPALKSYLSHPDKYVRMAALRGLAYIGDSSSIDLIITLRNDPEPLVSDRANMILKNYNK